MKERASKFVIFFTHFLLIGSALMVGMRAVEWVIPKPVIKSIVMVCHLDGKDQKQRCEYITDNIQI